MTLCVQLSAVGGSISPASYIFSSIPSLYLHSDFGSEGKQGLVGVKTVDFCDCTIHVTLMYKYIITIVAVAQPRESHYMELAITHTARWLGVPHSSYVITLSLHAFLCNDS